MNDQDFKKQKIKAIIDKACLRDKIIGLDPRGNEELIFLEIGTASGPAVIFEIPSNSEALVRLEWVLSKLVDAFYDGVNWIVESHKHSRDNS